MEAVFATSLGVERQQLAMDTQTGLITDFGKLGVSSRDLDWQYGDDCVAFAGMGDIHIHAREDVSGKNNYKEDFQTAGLAAINGGLTHVADMPNNPIAPIDDDSYRAKLRLTQKSKIPILLYAGIGPNTRPLSFEVPYKAYMGPSVGELYFKNSSELEQSIARYSGQWVSFHCEDPEEMDRHQHEVLHHLKRPVACEVMATKTALDLIEKFQIKGKLCHYSSGEGLKLIRAAKERGVRVTCEVTPQHLYFSQEQLSDIERGFFQMNPPIRQGIDRDAMLEAALKGEIDFLATDHAPHTKDEKTKGISGLTGLDSYGSFVSWLIVEKKFPLQRIAEMTSEKPGAFCNQFLPIISRYSASHQRLGKGVGFLHPGFSANITVLNLKRPTKLTSEILKTKVGHNPFVGVTFPGKVEQVILQAYAI